jgi:hypothetical protein
MAQRTILDQAVGAAAYIRISVVLSPIVQGTWKNGVAR